MPGRSWPFIVIGVPARAANWVLARPGANGGDQMIVAAAQDPYLLSFDLTTARASWTI